MVPDDVKTDDVKTDDVKTDDVKTDDVKIDDVKIDDVDIAGIGTKSTSAPTAAETMDLFLVVMGRVLQHISERSAEFELSASQAKALHHLAEPLSMGELAAFMFCDASNVTGIVDRLEGRSLVERQVFPGDRRVKRLVLTPDGSQLWRALHERIYADTPLVAGLSVAEQATLHDLLARIVNGPG